VTAHHRDSISGLTPFTETCYAGLHLPAGKYARRQATTFLRIEVVSKPPIGFKVKAAARFKPEEYIGYFEDLNRAPNAEIGPEGRF